MASRLSSVLLGVVRRPTQSPMRNGVMPQRLSPFSNALRRIDLAGTHQGRGPLELLNGEQPQRVPHQHGHAVFARSSRHSALQSPQAHDVGRQAQIGFGLAAARGEEQQDRPRLRDFRCGRGGRAS